MNQALERIYPSAKPNDARSLSLVSANPERSLDNVMPQQRKPQQQSVFSTWSQTIALIGTLLTIGGVLYAVSTRAENRLTTIETNIAIFSRSVDKLAVSQERLADEQRKGNEQGRAISENQVKILELFLLMQPRRDVRMRTIELINELKSRRRDYAGGNVPQQR